MAKITLSDLAPAEAVHFTGWKVDFDLGGSGKSSYESDDPAVISYAEVHPWLDVEYPPAVVIDTPSMNTLAEHPEVDALSGEGPNAGDPFDPEKVKETEEGKVIDMGDRVALDAGLDQSEPVVVGEVKGDDFTVEGVKVTLAADEEHEPAKTARNFNQTEKPADKPADSDTKGDA